MLEWFDWAGDYRLPVAMVTTVVANVVVIGGFVLLMSSAPYWLNDFRSSRARKAKRAAASD
jgi:hypothetical protein